jgi:hypothetical protein
MEARRLKLKGISIWQVTLALTVWFAIAVFSSASGATLALRPPFPQVVLCGLLGLLFVAFGYLKAFRSWLYAIPLHFSSSCICYCVSHYALPFKSHATCALLDLEYIGIYRHIIRRDDGNTTCASRP